MLFENNANIPPEILPDMRAVEAYTARNKKEISATFCRKPGLKRLFTANAAGGEAGSVQALDCRTVYGQSERIGDVHTHPSDSETIGILPSQDDMFTTLVDSYNNARPQVSCITNSETPLIECYKPRALPTPQMIDVYRRELHKAEVGEPGFYMDRAHQDFAIEFYDRLTGKHIKHPKASLIVSAAFGNSHDQLRQNVHELERAGFCEYVRSFTAPTREDVTSECVKELRKQNILGFIDV